MSPSKMSKNKPTHPFNKNSISYTYNPENQTPEELMENFVIRTKEFQRIYRDISDTALDENPQHFLLEGQRGTGKTSIMLRLRYEIERQQQENKHQQLKHLLAIQLREEQYGIFSLCKLWERVAEHLENTQGFEALSDELQSYSKQKDYATSCFSILDSYLLKNQKRIVLFLDNFGDMLDKFSDIELKRLRDIFHTSKQIQLIAASARTLEYTYKHDEPFYEFFNIVRLKSLSNKQATALLEQLALRHGATSEIERIKTEHPERIETIRLLTGGMPRTIVLLFEIFLDQNGDVFEDLEALLDRVTPLYKHRMDDLKPKQQAIVDVIALNWDGISTAEIVERLNDNDFDSKKVAAQLKALEKNGLVESKKIDKKNNIYFIKERFFNIWYLMRLSGRKDKCRVKWLVEFLRAWYSQESLSKRIEKHVGQATQGQLNEKSAYYLTEAMAQITNDLWLQDVLISSAETFLTKSNSTLAKQLSTADAELFIQSTKEMTKGNNKAAINTLKKISKSYEGLKEDFMASAYLGLNEIEKAKEYCKKAIRYNQEDSFFILSYLYLKEGKFKEADNIFREYLTLDTRKEPQLIYLFFLNAIARKQYSSSYLLFKDFPRLKDELKPTYYALMILLKDEYPKEYLKMGKELEPIINEILETVQQNREMIDAH